MKAKNYFNYIKVFALKTIRVIAAELERGDRIHRELETRKAEAHLALLDRRMFPY